MDIRGASPLWLLLAASAAASAAPSDLLLVILAFASRSRKPSLAMPNLSASVRFFSTFLGFGNSAFPLFAAACRLAFFVGGGAVGECIGFSKGTGELESFCFFWRCT